MICQIRHKAKNLILKKQGYNVWYVKIIEGWLFKKYPCEPNQQVRDTRQKTPDEHREPHCARNKERNQNLKSWHDDHLLFAQQKCDLWMDGCKKGNCQCASLSVGRKAKSNETTVWYVKYHECFCALIPVKWQVINLIYPCYIVKNLIYHTLYPFVISMVYQWYMMLYAPNIKNLFVILHFAI